MPCIHLVCMCNAEDKKSVFYQDHMSNFYISPIWGLGKSVKADEKVCTCHGMGRHTGFMLSSMCHRQEKSWKSNLPVSALRRLSRELWCLLHIFFSYTEWCDMSGCMLNVAWCQGLFLEWSALCFDRTKLNIPSLPLAAHVLTRKPPISNMLNFQ